MGKGGKIMSRFTGSTWKVSRRLGYSISETGKELKNVLMHLVNMVKDVQSYQTMANNYMKNKS